MWARWWWKWWWWEGMIMISKGMIWGEFEFMVEIMRVLGELIFLGRGCEYTNVKCSTCEFLSSKSMPSLKCEMAWLILWGKYRCNIEKTQEPITFFMLLSNVPIIKCNCESYTLSKGSSLSSKDWVLWYFWKGKIIISKIYTGRIRCFPVPFVFVDLIQVP